MGITPDEVVVTRSQIEQQKLDSDQAQFAYDRDADALQLELDAQIAVLDA